MVFNTCCVCKNLYILTISNYPLLNSEKSSLLLSLKVSVIVKKRAAHTDTLAQRIIIQCKIFFILNTHKSESVSLNETKDCEINNRVLKDLTFERYSYIPTKLVANIVLLEYKDSNFL